jgi:hypothetical protein
MTAEGSAIVMLRSQNRKAVPNARHEFQSSGLTDPTALLERIAYRNDRMLDHLAEKDDPVAFVRLMGGHNRTDLRRLAELLGADF